MARRTRIARFAKYRAMIRQSPLDGVGEGMVTRMWLRIEREIKNLEWFGMYGRMDARGNSILGWKSRRIWERLKSYGREKDLFGKVAIRFLLLCTLPRSLRITSTLVFDCPHFTSVCLCSRSFGLSKIQDSDHHNALLGNEEFVSS